MIADCLMLTTKLNTRNYLKLIVWKNLQLEVELGKQQQHQHVMLQNTTHGWEQ